jgi:hypothetical protein
MNALKDGKAMPKLPIAATYTVDLTTMGAPFLAPFMCFELNNNVFGQSLTTGEGDDLQEILPRILTIFEVTHKISGLNFETSVKCKPTGLSYKKFMDSRTGDQIYNLTALASGLKQAEKEKQKALKDAKAKG